MYHQYFFGKMFKNVSMATMCVDIFA